MVPTRDRPASLERCLVALRASRRAGSALELIVVDDGSAAVAAVREVARAHGAAIVRREGRGPAAARNAGVAATARPIVMFVDDDCEPLPDWAGRMLAALAGERVVAGRTASPAAAAAPVRAGQAITNSLLLGSLQMPGARLGFAPSCNLAAHRETLERIGFDERFPSAAGEDRDWCERLLAAGSAIAYEPRAVVVHAPPMTTTRFLRQQLGYGRGATRYRRAGEGRGVAPTGFWRELSAAGRREGPRVATLLAAAQLVGAAGAVAEALRAEPPRPGVEPARRGVDDLRVE